MSNGVRNLRAMFENKDDSASPPSYRGRSPAGSTGPGSNGTSPRPLSKVRTSFVAVERSGQLGNQLGLKRENSGEPSMAKRRASFSIDEEEHPQTTAERKQSIASEFDARKNSTVIEETIPEVAVETPLTEVDKQLGGGDMKTTKSSGGAVNLKKAAANNSASNGHTNGSSKAATTEKTIDRPSSTKFTGRPTPISTAKTSAASKSSPKTIKSPVAPKTPTTPRGRPKEPVKQPEKKSEKKETKPAASSHTSKPVSKPSTTTTSNSAPKTRIPPSPPQTGFVKPKPRSPTRPIKLPASLTAHTASSGSKTATAAPPVTSIRRSLSRASGNSQATNSLQTHATLSRSPSRVSAATAPKSLTRSRSTLNKAHGRPSLGPPPSQLKKQPSRQSLPPSAPADEGFLARMMRPTTSSASKTAEKVTTPPKRAQSVKRPVTRDGPPKHEASKAAAPKMGKLVAKPAAKETKSATSVAPEKAKGESKSAELEEPKPKIQEVSLTPDKKTQSADEEEPTAKAIDIQEPAADDSKAIEADIGMTDETRAVAEPATAVLEKVPEVESTPEKPAPIDESIAAVQEPAKNEGASAVTEESAFPEPKEEAPEKTEDVEAVKEAIETSKCEAESVPEKTVDAEVEIPETVEAMEDPEDVKAREEIARMNAEVMKAAAEAEDVE